MSLAAMKQEFSVDEKIDHLEAENAQMRDVLCAVSKELSAFGLDMAAIAGAMQEISSSSIEEVKQFDVLTSDLNACLLYTSPSPRDQRGSRMPSSA